MQGPESFVDSSTGYEKDIQEEIEDLTLFNLESLQFIKQVSSTSVRDLYLD